MLKNENSPGGAPPTIPLPGQDATVEVILSAGLVSVNDPNVKMIPGPVQITWQISSTSPAGTTFPATGGIVFAPNSAQPDVWPYDQPAYNAANGTYSVTYTNGVAQGQKAVTYNYGIVVSSNGATYSNPDPDVTNDPPG